MLEFTSTEELETNKNIIDQVIGQEQAVDVVKKASRQRRHILLIGEPGTGKSLLGMGLAQLLPKEKLVDILSFSNPNDENQPMIRVLDAGKGRDIVEKSRTGTRGMFRHQNIIMVVLLIISLVAPWWAFNHYSKVGGPLLGGLMFFAFFVGGIIFLISFVLFMNFSRRTEDKSKSPKVIVDNYGKEQVPFFDATGAHAGALLGDVLHDPFQTFKGDQTVTKIKDGKVSEVSLGQETDRLFKLNKKRVLSKGSYEAVHLPEDQLFVYGEQGEKIAPVEVLSSNRYFYDGDMIKISTTKEELTVTPEHKIAVWKNGKINYVEARRLKEGDGIVAKSNVIMEEKDLVQACSGKEESLPIIKELKERKLLPLTQENEKLPLISKILGFALGGLKEKVLKVSASEQAVKEFETDLVRLFGAKNEEENPRIFKTSNKMVTRFLKRLNGSKIPSWIKMRKDLERLFYGSLIARSFSMHAQKCSNSLTLNLSKDLLKELKDYLTACGIRSKVSSGKLSIEGKIDNEILLTSEIEQSYGSGKLVSKIQGKAAEEKNRYDELIEKGYGAEKAMKSIDLTPRGLYLLLNHLSSETGAVS